MTWRWSTGRAWIVVTLCCSACSGESALAPAGRQAARISDLWWLFFWVTLAAYVATVGALAVALVRSGKAERAGEARTEHRMRMAVVSGLTATVVLLFVLLVSSVVTGRTLHGLRGRSPVTIGVTAHQWWWDVEYDAPMPANRARTANEIHIPVGEPVLIRLSSADVIHSFWVPRLHGKRDAIPGHASELWIEASHPGIYRGQCAEFCGHQHALMGLLVVAEPRARFERWLAAQREPAPPATSPQAIRGRDLFVSAQCVMCHAVRGTVAGSRVGPDLTHLASRHTLAAVTEPNTRGHLAGWIADPQSVKPGARMPSNLLPPDDLQALLAYLGELR